MSVIIGNQHIINNVKDNIKNNKVHHSYIIEGGSGSGKKTIANYMAKMLLCSGGTDNVPCNQCVSCISVDSGNNPDLVKIIPDKKTLGVEEVRNKILTEVNIKPYNSKYKVIIIESADKLTIQSQNAILKTIEEPPEYIVFIMISENVSVFLETILSRVVVYKAERLKDEVVYRQLLNDGVDEHKANLAVNYANGSLGYARSICENEEFFLLRDDVINMLSTVASDSLVQVMQKTKQREKYKDNIATVLSMIEMFYRDIIVLKSTGSSTNVIQKDILLEIQVQSELFTLNNLYKKFQSVQNARVMLSKNSNYNLTIDMLMLKLKEK